MSRAVSPPCAVGVLASRRTLPPPTALAKAADRLRGYWEGLKPLPSGAADHDYANVFARSRIDLERLLPIPLSQAAIVVLGCGYRYPDVLLFSQCARSVVGLDVRPAFYRDGSLRLFGLRRQKKGILAAAYNTIAERRGLRRYYRRLSRCCGASLDHRQATVLSFDGRRSSLPDESFDASISNAVLQHVMDLESFFAEAARLTKAGGVSYHVLHNYCSFSGSLRPEWFCRQHPWGHLRGVYQTNPLHLNAVRIGPMCELFRRRFEIIDVIPLAKNHAQKGRDPDFEYEHPELLTRELRQELSAYPEEELLVRSFLLIGRKK